MRFEWRREGPAHACGANCRVWISAIGYITADTPREFETFAKDPNTRGAVLVLDSDGGSVLGTLALGRAIRSLGMITTIGKTTALPPSRDGERRATLSPDGKRICYTGEVPGGVSVFVKDVDGGNVRRVVPEITICTTLVAVRSFTPRVPAIVAKGDSWLTPVQS